MRPPWRFIGFVVLALGGGSSGGAADFAAPRELPTRAELPDALTGLDGRRAATAQDWWTTRRPELKELFQHYMYGHLPPATGGVESVVERQDTGFFGGKATLREVAIRCGPADQPPIHLLLVVPNRRTRPAPVVLGLNFCGNHSVLADPRVRLPAGWMPAFCEGCTNHFATEDGRGKATEDWAIERSVDRGYAIATFYNGDVEPDTAEAGHGGVRSLQPPIPGSGSGRQRWGTIAAWAWGLHRAVDYLHTDRELDTNRIAVFGHSRNGKTALLAGAFDDRIDLVLSHQAGCGGTAPSRGKIGESVKQINDRFPHWFAEAFREFNEHPERLPFDQHCLIAMCAPRPVLLSNATEDTWANPAGQFEMLRAADPVYRLLRSAGLAADRMPETGRLIDSPLGYFIRPGKHSTTPADWAVFLDFADRHFGRP